MQVRYAIVAEHRDQFRVRSMCQCLRIQQIVFYAWQKTPLSQRAREDARQMELIRQGLERQRQDLSLPQATRRPAGSGRGLLSEPGCPVDLAGGYQGADRLQASAGELWWQATLGGRQQSGS